ncbi:hypothetical protein QYM36_003328 [Artemia franciscana]|uniref:Dynein light chain roadblock n=1 Tax=Artemia franciscana TaxID=6661 RepID=A0AA88I7Z6_ARTSF|nr:hypothetical protein QYM36_003328 [Artemia franciscana]
MATEVEEILKRIQSHKGVIGVVVLNNDGVAIKSTLDAATTTQYAGLITQLADRARSMTREMDPNNDLTFLRVRSKKHEIFIAPDKEYMLVVVQNQESLS